MDTAVVTALAAVGGSLVGGFASFATAWLTQRQRSRVERLAAELDKREAMYVRFNELGMALLLDSIDKQLDEPNKLADLAVLMGRIRLVASEPVLRAAEAVLADVIASYGRPARDWREVLLETESFSRTLIEFTEAGRAERDAMLRGL